MGQQADLSKPVTREEIKIAMLPIDGEKAPGPDGFSSQFYQDNWAIVKEEVFVAV